jgi:hypothetical protein
VIYTSYDVAPVEAVNPIDIDVVATLSTDMPVGASESVVAERMLDHADLLVVVLPSLEFTDWIFTS